jgi:hypothetical protein
MSAKAPTNARHMPPEPAPSGPSLEQSQCAHPVKSKTWGCKSAFKKRLYSLYVQGERKSRVHFSGTATQLW